jgi:hypothetical protein
VHSYILPLLDGVNRLRYDAPLVATKWSTKGRKASSELEQQLNEGFLVQVRYVVRELPVTSFGRPYRRKGLSSSCAMCISSFPRGCTLDAVLWANCLRKSQHN